ncbi:MAG: multicopper oxidase domain-containing protein [Proteobacteria bacterium]|nr:multicopper oxidase domain-containing protein [Pseudomonadota bacterium]
MRWLGVFFLGLLLASASAPLDWYPDEMRIRLAQVFGVADYEPAPMSHAPVDLDPEERCPEDFLGWRKQQVIDGVQIEQSAACVVDNPHAVAAFVKGTNRVSQATLMAAGVTADAVEKGADLDGDGDPDEIHIRLEVVELNGGSPESREPTTQYAVAPGILPGFWVFAPKTFGMATENFESAKAQPLFKVPSPTIRVEQGDRVQITLENSHYMPHTIHFHGVDHPFLDANGEGNDGVPITSEMPVMPGSARTYDMQPRQSGTMFYHCHVQVQVHVMMGLQGLFVVEENRPNNFVQTLNLGAGHVRVRSAAVAEGWDREYDLHYLNVDSDLNNLIQKYNDPRLITEAMHRRYNITQAASEYFLLNGRSFPYTFRESLVVADSDEKVKLRIANGGSEGIALHTHGHKATITHLDGVAVPPVAQLKRDVIWIASAQRADLTLQTTDDGLNSYGRGVWLLHDHQEKGVTTNGISPGGNVSAIVYNDYLGDDGWPLTFGMNFDPFFDPAYYQGKISVWAQYDPQNLFGNVSSDGLAWRPLMFWLGCALAGLCLVVLLGRGLKR